MTMEVSSNSRDGLSLQLSVEQWELLRRLRNSHLNKTQIIRAYDELDRLDRELGNLFHTAPPSSSSSSSSSSSNSSTLVPTVDPVSPSTSQTQQISPPPSSISNNKRSHSLIQSRSSSTNSNGTLAQFNHSTNSPNVSHRARNATSDALISQYEALTNFDLEEETRELQEFLSKGDVGIHNEISVFVYRYDLKQSQIARMAAVNQAYVSKFLRGDLFDLSENGRMAICRWYIRYRKIVQSMGAGPASVEFLANLASSCEPPTKMPRLIDSQTTNSVSFDAPKRTRFTFRPEHLDILEKAFLDNPYPDPRRREDLARICNEARTRIDGVNEVLNERDRVTDAIVTHWFQNKRKMAKSQRVSIHDESMSMNPHHQTHCNNNNNNSNTQLSATNDFENLNADDDVHVENQRKTIADGDCYDAANALLDPQLAAYRAIMSRMVPFANHLNGNNSPKRTIKQETFNNPDESSQDNESNSSSSPLNDHLSP